MIMNQIVSGEGGGGLDTYDATAYPEHILDGYTAYARGAKLTGTAKLLMVDTYTKLLLHFSSDFSDSCGNTVFVAGNAQITNDFKFSPGAGLFGLSTDHVYVYPNEATYFGASDFTIDFWIKPKSLSGNRFIFCQRAGFKNQQSVSAYFSSDGKIRLVTSLNGSTITTTTFNTPLALNTWQHVALVRHAETIMCFFNGVKDSVTYTIGIGSVIYRSYNPFTIGGIADSGQSSDSVLDEFRISIGIARWVANFVVNDEPYSEFTSNFGADATATPQHILNGYTAYAQGLKITGTLLSSSIPSGTGRIEKYLDSMTVSGGQYTGVALDLSILDNIWVSKVITKLNVIETNATLNIRAFSDKSIIYSQTNITINDTETIIVLNTPVLLCKSQTVIFEFLFSSPKNLLRHTNYLYSGTIWRIDQNHVNTYAGTGYSETPYFGLIEYKPV
jgi:hypothetical protein